MLTKTATVFDLLDPQRVEVGEQSVNWPHFRQVAVSILSYTRSRAAALFATVFGRIYTRQDGRPPERTVVAPESWVCCPAVRRELAEVTFLEVMHYAKYEAA